MPKRVNGFFLNKSQFCSSAAVGSPHLRSFARQAASCFRQARVGGDSRPASRHSNVAGLGGAYRYILAGRVAYTVGSDFPPGELYNRDRNWENVQPGRVHRPAATGRLKCVHARLSLAFRVISFAGGGALCMARWGDRAATAPLPFYAKLEVRPRLCRTRRPFTECTRIRSQRGVKPARGWIELAGVL